MKPSELLNKEFEVPEDNKLRRWPSTPVVIVKERKKSAKKRRRNTSKSL